MVSKKKKKYYVADFETTSKAQYEIEGETRVYLYYIENIYNDDDNNIGCNIKDFIDFVTTDNKIVYFHNLTFDGLFIEYYLVENNIKYDIIRDEYGSVYRLVIYKDKIKVEFRDSLKILVSSVDDLPNTRGIKKLKGYDYEKIRNEKTINDFSSFDIDYIHNDVWKVKDCLKEILEDIGDSLTIASSSFKEWKKMYNAKDKYAYKRDFPFIKEDVEKELRKAYEGGLVILNPKIKGKLIEEPIISFDVNSLYPSKMYYKPLPYGSPQKISNEKDYQLLKEQGFKLFIFCVEVIKMKIKKDFHSFITKNKRFNFTHKKEFLNVIENHIFYWTNIDLENVKKYYDIEYNIYYDFSFAFRSKKDIFKEYISKYMRLKIYAENPYKRLLSKLRLNSLYGKFGSKKERYSRVTNRDGELLTFDLELNESKTQYYLPIAIFITSYARDEFINGMQSEREGFLYGDTDSLKIIKRLYKNTLNVNDKALGKWKFEGEFKKSIFLANKQYIVEDKKGTIERKIASLNRENQILVNFDNFKVGNIIQDGKNIKKHVKGGFIIYATDFTFKE